MECTPRPRMLLSMRDQGLHWKVILAELIDNSLDAEATRVDVRFGPKNQLRIQDNGLGCSDIQNILVLGKHIKHRKRGIGRFGIGLKDSACSLWGETRITTVHKGTRYGVQVNWPVLAKQDNWTLPDPVETGADGEIGTTIWFRNIERPLPQTAHFPQLLAEISYMFMPGLLRGAQITFRRPGNKVDVCAPYQMPLLTHVVEDDFEVEGKGVRLRAGIVQDACCNKKPGFSFIHKHRVIRCSALGANGMNVERVAGTITLDHQWKLSKNKTDLVDGQERLGEAIYLRCEPMLKEAYEQASHIESEHFNREIAKRLNEAMSAIQQDAKEKRKSPANKSGAVKPVNSGKTRKKAKTHKPGDNVLEVLKRGKFQLSYKHFDEETIGEVDLPGETIWLSDNNPHLGHLRSVGNSDATFAIALGLLVHSIIDQGQQQHFPCMGISEGFLGAWASIMSSVERHRSSEPAATTAAPCGTGVT